MQAILDIFIFLVTVFSIIVCVNGQLTIIDLGICCYAIIRKMQQCYSSIVGEVAFLEVWGWEKPHKKWCVIHYLLIAFLNGAYIALPDTNIVLKCFFHDSFISKNSPFSIIHQKVQMFSECLCDTFIQRLASMDVG